MVTRKRIHNIKEMIKNKNKRQSIKGICTKISFTNKNPLPFAFLFPTIFINKMPLIVNK